MVPPTSALMVIWLLTGGPNLAWAPAPADPARGMGPERTPEQERAILLTGAGQGIRLEPVVLELAPRPAPRIQLGLTPVHGPQSRAEATLAGMSKAASVIGALGGFGASFGWWEDRTAWKLIAAAAATGAALGALT